ncbi:hypothetical protein A2U01_0022522 [Trifolium medium]|uniref:Reverse transcriptase/retrotransposon-derived protein RNase H-like domain-containing protein n=1 Tax=Trifolium medium TaxID=97028 RepID=A0A392NQY6_9FABA|nr:hypothetical protein [Trifolium medium]
MAEIDKKKTAFMTKSGNYYYNVMPFGVKAGKFLGFYLTERGIEANPDKCRAFFEFPTPDSKKSIQSLNGMLTALSRFVTKSAQHALPLFKLLRKDSTFEWTKECEHALQHLKRALSEPPVLTRPREGETLYLYLAVASEAISAVLIRETCVFCEQSIARSRNSILADRKDAISRSHGREETKALLSSPHHHGTNRPANKTTPRTARHYRTNAEMVA